MLSLKPGKSILLLMQQRHVIIVSNISERLMEAAYSHISIGKGPGAVNLMLVPYCRPLLFYPYVTILLSLEFLLSDFPHC